MLVGLGATLPRIRAEPDGDVRDPRNHGSDPGRSVLEPSAIERTLEKSERGEAGVPSTEPRAHHCLWILDLITPADQPVLLTIVDHHGAWCIVFVKVARHTLVERAPCALER